MTHRKDRAEEQAIALLERVVAMSEADRDALPGSARVIVASPCSGHGFKHSAAIGEALAQRVIDGASRIDLSAFSLTRFGA